MFDPKEETESKTLAALAVLREYKRGDCVPHDELAAATGLRPTCGGEYYDIVMKARRRLRDEDGIWSRPETSEGFHLLTERETLTEEPRRRAKRARKQIAYTIKAAVALPKESLSFNLRRLQEAVVNSATDMRRKLIIKAEIAEKASQPFVGSPRRSVPVANVNSQSNQQTA